MEVSVIVVSCDQKFECLETFTDQIYETNQINFEHY